MCSSLLKAVVWPTAACIVGAIAAGSFAMGYFVGHSQAWEEIVARDPFTFNAVQEYLKNKPDR